MKNPPASTAFDFGPWLRRPLTVTHANQKSFPRGRATEWEIVTTHRLILVLKGQMNYTLEKRRLRVPAGTQLFVPAWSKRVWSVPAGDSCEILWCEFDDAGMEPGHSVIGLRPLDRADLRLERQTMHRIHRGFREGNPALVLEGELKAALARFWHRARRVENQDLRMEKDFHPRLKTALRWLEEHFCEPTALRDLYRHAELSPNYFRRQFLRALQCSPQTFIERLRLRRARYLLHETTRSVKEVADAVGYADPLHFSKRYHRFWKSSPSRERRN